MRVAIANQKGGVGKTTTAVNLATSLGGRGYRCLLVDLDPQANATTGLGFDHRDLPLSTYDVVIDGRPAADAIVETDYEGLHLLPSAIDLAGAELELVPAMAREGRLRRGLEGLVDRYDVVFIDCPPSLGLLTVNALTAADRLLIPIQCEYYALEGLTQLLRNVELVRSGLNARLEIGGIVLTMYDARTKLSEQVADEVRQHFPDQVFSTVIPRSVRLSEAPSYGQPAVTYDPSSRGSMAYTWLAQEFEQRLLDGPRGRPEAGRATGGAGADPRVSMTDAQREEIRTVSHAEWQPDERQQREGRPADREVWPRPAPPEEEADGAPSEDDVAPDPPPPADGVVGTPGRHDPGGSDESDEEAGEQEAEPTERGRKEDAPWSYGEKREGWR